MRFTNCLKIVCVSALMVCATSVINDQAQAIPSGPSFPPPGNVAVTGSGATGATGGRTLTFGAFDTNAFSDLWWGPTQILGPLSSPSGTSGGTSQNIGANSPVISGNTATWTASSPWTIATVPGNITPQVRFTLSTFDLGNNAVNLISAASVPLLFSAGAVLDVTGSGLTAGYKANYLFEAFNGTTWVADNTYFNSVPQKLCTSTDPQSPGCVINSVSAGFWSNAPTSAPVPEPGSILLLGAGLVGLGLGRYLVNRIA